MLTYPFTTRDVYGDKKHYSQFTICVNINQTHINIKPCKLKKIFL